MKILHLGKKGNVERNLPEHESLADVELVDLPMGTAVEDILKAARDAEYLIADAIAEVPAGLIDEMPGLKLIHSEGVAYNRFDTKAAAARHVYVCNCKGMNAMAVAEQTVLLMLGLLRDVRGGDAAVRDGRQIETKEGYMTRGDLRELSDLKVGLVGFGDIARCVAQLMRAFGAETYYFSRHRASPETEEKYHVAYLPLDELSAGCQMFSIHIPAMPETFHMIGEQFFRRVPFGSYFVNTARGEVVDSGALLQALKCGKIRRAGLDTLEGEPVQRDNLLVAQPEEIADRILFSPHIAGITASSFRRGYGMIWENIHRMENGEMPKNVVNAWE
ncbi:MAG: hydroxyacid dehydrogenase [Clostridiales bacterium]|nr:hydroxyacid dehydrogenase [Clostridiales bacterium]MCD8155739.1 hydroxyacid dehydrogenase [Clostridiales bacterium]